MTEKPICEVGWNCGDGCISRRKRCKKFLSEEIISPLEDFSSVISSRKSVEFDESKLSNLANDADSFLKGKKANRLDIGDDKTAKKKLLAEENQAWLYLRTYRHREKLTKLKDDSHLEEIDRLTKLLQKLAIGDKNSYDVARKELEKRIEEGKDVKKKETVSEFAATKIEEVVDKLLKEDTLVKKPEFTKTVDSKVEKILSESPLDFSNFSSKTFLKHQLGEIDLLIENEDDKELKDHYRRIKIIYDSEGKDSKKLDAYISAVNNCTKINSLRKFYGAEIQAQKLSEEDKILADKQKSDLLYAYLDYHKAARFAFRTGTSINSVVPLDELKRSENENKVSELVPKSLVLGELAEDDDLLARFLSHSQIYSQVPIRAFESIVLDGKMKKLLDGEISEHASKYDDLAEYVQLRKDVEEKVLNLDQNLSSEKRPTYCYTERPEVVDFVSTAGALFDYGEIRLSLKSKIKERATVTVGDSINRWDIKKDEKAVPFNAPTKSYLKGELVANKLAITASDLQISYGEKRSDKGVVSYLETQIFGGITLEDISEVSMPTKYFEVMPDTTKRILSEKGIKISTFIDWYLDQEASQDDDGLTPEQLKAKKEKLKAILG